MPHSRQNTAGMPSTVIIACFVDRLRACLIPNIHIFALHSKRRIWMMVAASVNGCMGGRVPCENSMVGGTARVAASPMTAPMIVGMKPYPTNSNTRLNDPVPLNSIEMA